MIIYYMCCSRVRMLQRLNSLQFHTMKERWKRHEYDTIMMSAKFTRVVPAPSSFTHITALSRPAADDPRYTNRPNTSALLLLTYYSTGSSYRLFENRFIYDERYDCIIVFLTALSTARINQRRNCTIVS